jgi:hypothetical protein
MPDDRTTPSSIPAELPEAGRIVHPLSPSEQNATLGVGLIPTVDNIRQIAVDMGLRPYRVYLVHVMWSGGQRGAGKPSEVSRREILPTPKLLDMQATTELLSAFGHTEDGSLVVDKISAKYSEDDLLGWTPDLADPARPNTGNRGADFFWEIAESRATHPMPMARRYDPQGAPMLRLPGGWRVSLAKRDADRDPSFLPFDNRGMS